MTSNPGWNVTAGGRLFRITADALFLSNGALYRPVDVRDLASGMTAQAIIAEPDCRSLAALLRLDDSEDDRQFRDAFRSSYQNATGLRLPDDFTISPA